MRPQNQGGGAEPDLTRLHELIQQQEREIEKLWSQVQELETQLGALTSSRAYHFVQRLNHWRWKLAPPSSPHGALLTSFARAAAHLVRGLRQIVAALWHLLKRPNAPPSENAAIKPARAAGRPLRVLVQLDRFGQGGLEQVVLDLLSGLRKAGAEVHLLVTQETTLPFTLVRRVERLAHLEAGDPIASYRDLLVREQIDLVSSHYSLFGAAAAHALGVPFVQTVQNTYVWLSARQIDEQHAADPYTTAYLCVSDEVVRYCTHRLGLSPEKMLVVPNGVSGERFSPSCPADSCDRLRAELGIPPDAFVFLNVASIFPPKAQRFAVRALARLREAGHDAWLVFLGGIFDRAYHERLLQDVKRLHLEDRVVCAGRRQDAPLFYRAANAFLLPSFWEGCSLALAEAILSGLPAVISRVGSADTFADLDGVLTVPPPFRSILDLDYRSLPKLLYADHPEYVERLALAMRQVREHPLRPALTESRRRNLDRETMVARYQQIFSKLLQGVPPAVCRTSLQQAPLFLESGLERAA